MIIANSPSAYVFAGKVADIKITEVSAAVTFVLSLHGAEILNEEYHPDPTGVVTIRLRDLLERSVNCPAMNVASHPVALYTWSVTGPATASGAFRCLKGGHRAGVGAANYVKHNFLTWQPQTRKTLYHTPHWLRYVAVVDGCKYRVKGYFADGTDLTVDLTGELAVGSIHTIDTNFGTICGLFDKQITYCDIWIEHAGVKLTWAQRYVLTDIEEGTPDYFVFENSLGGFDTVCFRGERRDIAESESSSAIFGDQTLEYGVDWKRTFKKNTGYFPDTNTRLWVLEFFSSTNRYHLSDGALNRIVISKPKLEAVDGVLSGYEFIYAASDQNRYENMARVPVPPNLTITDPAGQLFFLEPCLNQFKRADLTKSTVMIPVQSPHSAEWMAVLLSDLITVDTTLSLVIDSSNGQVFLQGQLETTLTAVVKRGIKDITATIAADDWKWTRKTGNTASDTIWSLDHANKTSSIYITDLDMNGLRATFTCEAYVRDNDKMLTYSIKF